MTAEPLPDATDSFRRSDDAWGHAPLGVPDARGASWKPLGLGPYLRDEIVQARPCLGLPRSDGLCLLYPGLEHTVIGEMESGKSWFCAASAAAELTQGHRVLYVHFEDAIPTDLIGRLRALGVADDLILEHLAFVGPHEPVDPFALAALLAVPPTLAILDGVNEGMSLHNQEIRNEDGAASFRKVLVKPFTRVGAAVLGCDHVVKDKDRRGRGPLGSIHKGNGLNGALILLENKEPFGRGQKGRSSIFITKDRPGFLRQHGKPTKEVGQTFMGTLIVDDTRSYVPHLNLAFLQPQDEEKTNETTQTKGQADDDLVLQSVMEVAAGGTQPSLRTVRAHTEGISNSRVDNALARLCMTKRLVETPGPNRSRLFSVPPSVPEPDKGENP